MAKVPFTSGKAKEGPKSHSGGTGGHTSGAVSLPKGATPGSTSNTNTRIGGLKKRQTGAPATKGMPR